MTQGKVYQSELLKFKDKDTGVEVTRLSDNLGNTNHPYFTQPVISKDGRYLLLASDRTGSYQLYKLDIKTGKLVQLTDDPGIIPTTSCLDENRLIAYYWSGRVLKSVDFDSLKTEELYIAPEGFRGLILSISSDGQYLTFAYTEEIELSSATGKIYSGGLEKLYRHPSSVIMRVNAFDKSVVALWGERQLISHVNTSPVDSDIVLFCHEGSWDLVQRMWIVKASTHEVWPLVEQKRHLERSGHEFFTKSGRVVTQYGKRSSPSDPHWQWSDIFVNPDGTGLAKYDYLGERPGHVQVNSTETLGVGDKGFITKDFADGDAFMSLIKYEDGIAKQNLLCRHDTSWEKQDSHPHPFFTPDNKFVIFNSDREGNTNVYMAPVEWK